MQRQCAYRSKTGEPCRAAPVKDSQYCIMHSPEHAQEIQEARRLGGLRRRREVTVSGAYDVESLSSIEGIRRLIEVAIIDTLSMENSISRNRTIAYLALAALRTYEVSELEQRISALEQSVHPDNVRHASIAFDVETPLIETPEKEEPDHEPG